MPNLTKFHYGKKNSGFSLIEMLISVAIMGMMVLAAAQMFTRSLRENMVLNRQVSFAEAVRSVQLILDNSATCQNFLRDPTNASSNLLFPAGSTNVPVGSIMMGSSAVAALNQKLGSDLTTTAITVTRDPIIPVDSFSDASGNPYLRYYVSLNLTATTAEAQPVGGKTSYTQSFYFVAVVNATSNQLESCVGGQSTKEFGVPLPELALYWGPVSSAFGNLCANITDPAVDTGYFNSSLSVACHRWCAGCYAGMGCPGGVLPGRGFTTGSSNQECDSFTSPNIAICMCFR